ncbi:MAG: efflux RND transporter permease subunit [Fuerstiella sp.]
MNLLARLSADHPLRGWCLVVLLSVPPLLGILGVRIAEPVHTAWVASEVRAELREVETIFRFNAPVVLVLECDDFFRAERIAALHRAVAALRDMPEVQKLVWMGDVPVVSIRGTRRPLLPEPDADSTEEELATARQALTTHPLAGQNLISADGRTALMQIDIRDKSHVRSIRAKAQEYLQPAGIRVRITGGLAIFDVHDRALNEDHLRIQLIAFTMIGFLAVLIFRRPVAVIVAGSGPATGVVWTIGWLLLIGQSENQLAKIILPVMILMIGFTDGVHLVVRIQNARAKSSSPRDAVFDAVLMTGPACLLTSLTTAIGFGSLMISDSEVIAGFGRVSAIGVVVTFLAVILVIPLLANSWLGQRMHVSTTRDPLTRLMQRCVGVIDFSSRHALPVTAFGIGIVAVCITICARLVPNDCLSDRIPRDSEEWQAMRDCDVVFGGVRHLRLVIEWPEKESRKGVWSVIEACEDMLAEEELLGPTNSIRTALSVFRGSDRRDFSVFVNQLPDELKHQFYRPDLRKTLVVTRLQDLGIATFAPVFDRIEDRLRQLERQHPGFQLKLISDVINEGRVVRQLIEELIQSLMVASVIIFAVMAVAFRSLRIGLISIIPNMMPLAASGAIRYMIDESLGIASACAFAVCLGIAVDDTIHYLSHFRHERRRGADPHTANRNTFLTVGSALVLTTMVMTAALGTILTSRLPPHVNFAAMGCITLAIALPADLLFLPALLTLFAGRSQASESNTT